ncbi:AraC family transcriptional regulator [Mucilaginibacter sp. OK098]|uniref:AraC family transcriptional regulator n=1 Tax=Mucilaginibacter sp. OK098 TaxID=1855297 RepID=UPI0009206720|nr:helix-turn-helix transcriptional regulator [Mucilaginibacter sp. OK098]SHN10634.1 transcriptional regulator, AraC family [Mucilaginibacter sp. OK098]
MLQSTPVYDICTLSDFRQDDILVSRFAPYLNHHKNLHAAHRHTFYHVVFFTDGAGSHTIDFENFVVKPNQIYFMIPGQVHSWSFEGFTDGYIINFSDSFFQSFLLNASYLEKFPFFSGDVNDAVINLPQDLHPQIKNLFEEIIKEWESSPMQTTDLMRVLMLQVFILINRFSAGGVNKGPASYNQTLLKNFQKLIEVHYKNLKLPKDYAGLLYITPNHLNAICKDLLGLQAGELIRNRTMLEAKRMLTNQQLTITEIAFELNFSDNSYFTKFFKKTEGVTPEEFRKNILNQNHHG